MASSSGRVRWMAVACGLCLLTAAAPAMAQVPAGYSEYYVPGDEDGMGLVLCAFGTGGNACPAGYHTHTGISVTAWSDATTIYYDHWENGYNFDPAHPGTTADETYTLNTGQRLLFEGANISLPRTATPPTGSTCTNYRNGTAVSPPGSPTCYDGKDRIYVAGGTATVVRVGWIEERGVGVQGVAWEIYPVKPQLTTYVVPFGETSGWHGFQHVAAMIQATRNNTVVTVDLNHDGTPDPLDTNRDGTADASSVTLQAGQSFLLDDTSAHVAAGSLAAGVVITGTDTLQVKYLAGNTADNYSTRGFSAFPRGFWTTDYYAPLDQPTDTADGLTDYYLYNPNPAAITVSWSSSAASGSFPVPATSAVSFRTATGGNVPVGSGLYFSGTDVFWGVGSNDSQGQAHEWGYSLLPSTMLYTEHYLGWAPDCLPAAAGCANDMGVFVTVAQDNTRVFVDLNSDGTVDQTYTLNRLQRQFISDTTDGDLSGARIWATGPFSMAYGQNANAGVTGAPALDLGYVAIPNADFVDLVLGVAKSVSPQVVPTAAGSQATFTIAVQARKYAVDGVTIKDLLPASWQYVAGTTTITRPDLTILSGASADPTVTGQTLSWSAGQTGGQMAPNQALSVTFTAQTTAALASGTLSQNQVQAVGTRTVAGAVQTFTAKDFVYVASAGTTGATLQVSKTSSVPAATPVYPGDTLTYTTTVTNPAGSGATLTDVSLVDPIPVGLSYAGAASLTCDLGTTRNVRDQFGTAAYNNSNGSVNWSANPWTETDAFGGGGTGATGGFVWITGGTLQFRYLATNVADTFQSVSYARQDGNINWTTNWLETGDDGTATGGVITANGTRLNFGPGTAGRSITRTAPVLGDSATISFTLSDNGIDAGEGLIAAYDLGLGAGWQEIQRIDNNTLTGTNPLTISTAGATSISLRFTSFDSGNGTWEAGDNAGVDNVNIAFNNLVGTQIQRTADLTGAADPQLTFTYTPANLDNGDDNLVLEASAAPAGPFTTLATFNAGVPDAAPPYDLTAYLSSTTTIRFRATGGFNLAGETLSLDNVDITYKVASGVASAVPITAAAPPDFLSSASGCLVAPGGIPVGLTFNATVNDPLPTGLTSITNTAYATAAQLPIQLSASVTNLVANPGVASASAGDRVWLDADGNGAQDIGEPGIANVEVTLKDQFGTPVATTVTDGNGRYLFSGVKPGTGYYVEATAGTLPGGLSQSFPAGYTNNRTTVFGLTDGQSYTGADLGYRGSSTTAAFGDLVWVDASGDGLHQPGEIGLGGVTVQLYRDSNGNGQIDVGEPVVATRTSAPDGSYLFTGVTASGSEDYIVAVVNPAGYNATTVTFRSYGDVPGGSVFLNADFGYQSTGPSYSLSDRVWYDANGDGAFSGESGIAGVTVELLDASLNVIGTTTTDASGVFTFSGLPGGGADYTTRISDAGNVLCDDFGTTPYARARRRSESNLSGNVDRTAAPSYGFVASRSIGDTVCADADGSGSCGAGEPGIGGVAVKLYLDPNNNGRLDDTAAQCAAAYPPATSCLVGTVTTDGSGQYRFSGLTSGAHYIVSVETPPAGYNYSGTGVRADSDGNPANGQQQSRTVVGAANVVDADFPYRPTTPCSLSGTTWNNSNGDTTVDAGEPLLAGVTLDIWSGAPGGPGATVVRTVITGANGGWDAADLAVGTYTVQVTDTAGVLNGYSTNYEFTEGANAPSYDFRETVTLSSATPDAVRNFGYARAQPTYAAVASFRAYLSGGSVTVEWRTSLEAGAVGFHLFRLDPASGQYRRLDERLLPALPGHPQGGTYRFQDTGAPVGGPLTYALQETDVHGRHRTYGPYTVSAEAQPIAASSEAGPETSTTAFDRWPTPLPRAAVQRLAAARLETQAATLSRRARRGGVLDVAVRAEGLYHLDLQAIAVSLGLTAPSVTALLRSGQFALSHRGQPVPWFPDPRAAGIDFYAAPLRSIYTDTDVYQLEPGPGLVMGTVPAVPASVVATSFRDTVHREVDQYPVPVAFQDPDADFWVWDEMFAGYDGMDALSVSIPAAGVAGAGSAALVVHLVGGSDSPAELDHHVTVAFNGTPVAEETWGGLGRHDVEIPMDGANVREGANTVELKAYLDEGVPESIVLLDSVDLGYERLYRAVHDGLAFTVPGATMAQVSGFSVPSVQLLDLSDPQRPALVDGAAILRAGDGSYAVRFGAPPGEPRRYLALTPRRVLVPAEVRAARVIGLRDGSNHASYVLVAPESLAGAAGVLAEYRNAQGISTRVVPLDAVYDEFNGGIAEPTAIREFLRYARKAWATPPRYVALIGRGTWDYKDVLGLGDNLLPPLLAASADGLFASDVRLADLDGEDGVPEVAVGRLPVVTSQELLDYVAKVQEQESAGTGEWRRHVLMAADNPDAAGAFTTQSDAVAAQLPPFRIPERVYLDAMPADAARQAVVDALNDGTAIFNYIGHGGFDRLADENLFTRADVASLHNAGRLPVFVAMTCAVGDFALPGYPSLAEALLLKRDGGAIAAWAPSGLSQDDLAVRLDASFFASVAALGTPVIGDVAVRALGALDAPGAAPIRHMYNLLGEPVSRVPE